MQPAWAARMEAPKPEKPKRSRANNGMTKWEIRQLERQAKRQAMMTDLFKEQYREFKSTTVTNPHALK